MRALKLDNFSRPSICKECGGIMIFKGVGEYKCERCNKKEYDDYGAVRNYLEKSPGANIAVISQETGVSRKSISMMVKECRFEVSAGSKVFLSCDMCGITIKMGRFCMKCEETYHKKFEEDVRRKNNFVGHGINESKTGDGAMHFYGEDRN